jgi:hypothetical protein
MNIRCRDLSQKNLWKIAVTLYNVRHDRLLAKVARDAPVNSRDLTKPNGFFRGMVDRSTHRLHWFRLATIERLLRQSFSGGSLDSKWGQFRATTPRMPSSRRGSAPTRACLETSRRRAYNSPLRSFFRSFLNSHLNMSRKPRTANARRP